MAWAFDANRTSIVTSINCGEMTQNLKGQGKSAENQYSAYIQGVIEGINASAAGKADFFEGTDATSRYLFVKKYCEDNPLDSMFKGVNAMVIKITGKNIIDLAAPPSTTPCPPAVNGKKKV